MKKSFFARRYRWIFVLVAFVLPFISRGARLAIQSNVNDVRDWLPPGYPESKELTWFQQHFAGEQFALVSWDGCTLGNTEKLKLLAAKLVPGDSDAPRTGRMRLFADVVTGPETIEEMTGPPLYLSYDEAVRRLEGALVGPEVEGQGHASRTTCLVVTLSSEGRSTNRQKRAAIEQIKAAAAECAIPAEHLHMGGPPVDNVAIDVEGERTLFRLAVLSFVVGLGLSYWCFRSVRLTAMVFCIGVVSAGLSLATVFYFGLGEVFILGREAARFGTVDAILMSMPAVVYVLGLSGAIHIVNYYRDARTEHGIDGAAERAVGHGWVPCTLAAVTTALGLASLYTSDILPIRKFGAFSAVAVVATLALLFTLLPAFLYRFPPPIIGAPMRTRGRPEDPEAMPPLLRRVAEFIIGHNRLVCLGWGAVLVVFAVGLTHIGSTVQLLKLFHKDADIIHDYRWLETHLGNLVPMEVVVRVAPPAFRSGRDSAEAGGDRYRLTLLERMELARRVQHAVENLDDVGRALTASTFAPEGSDSGFRFGTVGQRFALNNKLEEHYQSHLLDSDYLCEETVDKTGRPIDETTPRAQLWRISARVRALGDAEHPDMDYGHFVHDLRAAVEPILAAYRQRDRILRKLHAHGRELLRSDICFVVDQQATLSGKAVGGPAAAGGDADAADSDRSRAAAKTERVLAELLAEAGAKVRAVDWSRLPKDADGDTVVSQALLERLATQDCLVVTVPEGRLGAADLGEQPPVVFRPGEADLADKDAAISITYTGIVPLVYKTQRQLLVSLRESIAWAFGLIAIVMMCVLKSFSAGLFSMIPNLFPIIIVFGGMGWSGIKVDIGMMLTASVALGVAVDDTVHFLFWFQRGLRKGLNRQEATMLAYRRCAQAMFQTTVIAGLGLSMFIFSTFTPTRQFGFMMVALLTMALVGDLLLLPAMLAGPVGKFFCRRLQNASTEPHDETPAADRVHGPQVHMRTDGPHRSIGVSFGAPDQRT